MRYVLSDLHGEYDLFCKLLEKIRFSEWDEMIVCGDILDKGRAPIRLAKLIFSLPNIRCIMGNHEYQFLKFYWSLMERSPSDFEKVLDELRRYHTADGELLDWDVVDMLERLPLYIEEDSFICVHAGVSLTEERKIFSLEKTAVEQFVYDRTFKEPFVLPQDKKCVFFGHTPTNYINGKNEIIAYPRAENPRVVADYHKIHLDTGVYMTGIMGCFCLDTLQTVYVRE